MKPHDFIASSQAGLFVANLALVTSISRGRSEGIYTIKFGGGGIGKLWGYQTKEARDTDYQRIMERIGCSDERG